MGVSAKKRKEVWARVYSARLRPGMPLQAHVQKITRLFNHLELVGKPVEDEQAAHMLLSSLHSGYVACDLPTIGTKCPTRKLSKSSRKPILARRLCLL